MFFEQLIGMLNTRPMVPGKTAECLRLWETFTARQQQQIYDTIRTKLQAGKFVHYDPLRAIRENAHARRQQTLSYAEYYKRYGTTEPRDGWRMANPTGQKIIYVK